MGLPVIGYCKLCLNIPMAQSLKEKRSFIKSLQEKLKNKFNIAIAEIDKNNLWQSSVLGIVTVSKDSSFIEKTLNNIIVFIDEFYGVEISKYEIEYY